jgi:hypothetical protein
VLKTSKIDQLEGSIVLSQQRAEIIFERNRAVAVHLESDVHDKGTTYHESSLVGASCR